MSLCLLLCVMEDILIAEELWPKSKGCWYCLNGIGVSEPIATSGEPKFSRIFLSQHATNVHYSVVQHRCQKCHGCRQLFRNPLIHHLHAWCKECGWCVSGWTRWIWILLRMFWYLYHCYHRHLGLPLGPSTAINLFERLQKRSPDQKCRSRY